MGTVFASVAPVNLFLRSTLDQPCVDIRTPYPRIGSVSLWPYRSSLRCLIHRLLNSRGKSFRSRFPNDIYRYT
jgi:hypothetical protein